MGDPSIFAFSRMRRSERIMGLHCQAHDHGRADAAYDDVMADSAAWDDTTPTTWLGVTLKVSEALLCLEGSEDAEAPAEALAIRDFFRNRRTIDGPWLRDIRSLIKAVRVHTLEGNYAATCLHSILAGMSKPRLV